VRLPGKSEEQVIPGMPANTVDLERFFKALFAMAVDKRFSWQGLKGSLGDLGPIDRFLWEWAVIPNTRATLIGRRSELLPFLDPAQASAAGLKPASGALCKAGPRPQGEVEERCGEETRLELGGDYAPDRPTSATAWGPGRVDTFNPYKLIQFSMDA